MSDPLEASHRKVCRLAAGQDGFDDVGSEESQADRPAHIGTIATGALGKAAN